MKILAYSLFGYGQDKHPDCFDIQSLLRGFMINVRMARLYYPDYTIYLALDTPTYNAYSSLFDGLKAVKIITYEVLPPAKLCEAMLWRMRPLFMRNPDGFYAFDVVLCRDVDSPLTYLERQCVQEWVDSGKAAHAITDSISHCVPMLGGMVGFVPKHFNMYTGWVDWDTCKREGQFDFSNKGSDQDFLNTQVYPLFSNPKSESIMQHYLKGMGNTYLSGYRNTVADIDLKPYGVGDELKDRQHPNLNKADTMYLCGHIGSAGWYSVMDQHIKKYEDRFTDIAEIEKATPFTNILYWNS